MKEKTGIVKVVWLQMLSDGGYTTQPELRQAIPAAKRVGSILQMMVETGTCVRIKDPERTNGVRYGITPSCVVPRDVSLQEILDATGVGQ